jgi:hypothetical protein
MSRDAFKLRNTTDKFSEGYYLGHKEAVYINLFRGNVYGEGEETYRYLSNF